MVLRKGVTMNKKILSLSQQARVRNEWLEYRLANILPRLMERTGIDMWVVIAREYNEDPVMGSLFPAPVMTASRLTGLVFSYKKQKGLECFSLYPEESGMLSPYYTPVWKKGQETQWERLNELICEKKPEVIGIDTSEKFALADGLSKHLYDQFVGCLTEEYRRRLTSAEDLVVGWLETRSDRELQVYPGINNIIHSIIAEAFSNEVIDVGVTTTADVEWWMMEKAASFGLNPWFPFDVDLQREGEKNTRMTGEIIRPGDLLRCDVGIDYLGLKTDTQRLAYVLKLHENNAPEGMKTALGTGNRFQDIVCEQFAEGKTGNEILLAALKQAETENIKAELYTHPIGVHGHGAGPTIGLWDNQKGVSGRGDYPLYTDTCYALELNIAQNLPEWNNQELRICLEQTVAFRDGQVFYLDGRQTDFLLIR